MALDPVFCWRWVAAALSLARAHNSVSRTVIHFDLWTLGRVFPKQGTRNQCLSQDVRGDF